MCARIKVTSPNGKEKMQPAEINVSGDIICPSCRLEILIDLLDIKPGIVMCIGCREPFEITGELAAARRLIIESIRK